jgi:hypothetical protein
LTPAPPSGYHGTGSSIVIVTSAPPLARRRARFMSGMVADSGSDKTGHSDLFALERSFERLLQFVRDHPLPLPRAMAIAAFVGAIPAELQGRSYYLAEVLDPFLEALAQLRGAVADPEHVQRARRALGELAAACLVAAGDAAGLADGLGAPPARPLDPGAGEESRDASRILVAFVQSLPAVPGETVGTAIGLIAPLTVVPRVRRARESRFLWNNGQASHGAGSLRALDDVSADAYLAAVESVAAFARRSGRLPPHLPDLLPRRARTARRYGRRLGFELSLPPKEIGIAGDSIGLALAVAFAGVLTGIACRGRGLRPRADLAWIGCVSTSGRVLPVDRHTLAAQLRAARYAKCRGVVVPAEMTDRAAAEVKRQGLDLRVIGVDRGADVLADPELVEALSVRAEDVEACTREKRYRVIRVAAAAALAALMVWSVPPRPREAQVVEPRHQVRVSYQGLWPPFVVQADGPIMFAAMDDRLDGDRNPRRRLVVATACDVVGGHAGDLTVYDLAWRRPIWSHRFQSSGLPYEPQDVWTNGAYSTKEGAVGDVDGDARDEIVLTACYTPYAASFVWLFDGMRGPNGAIYHEGHLEHLALHDVDGDGRLEAITAGMHEPSRGVSILVLRNEDFHPFQRRAGPGVLEGSAIPWEREAQPCLTHLVVPMPVEMTPIEGRQNLGHGGNHPLTLVAAPGGGVTIRYDVNASNALIPTGKSVDYMVSFRVPCRDVDLIVNDTMRQRAAQWKRAGATSIDFGSDDFVRAWRARCRCADHVLVDWPENGRPSPAPPAASRDRP